MYRWAAAPRIAPGHVVPNPFPPALAQPQGTRHDRIFLTQICLGEGCPFAFSVMIFTQIASPIFPSIQLQTAAGLWGLISLLGLRTEKVRKVAQKRDPSRVAAFAMAMRTIAGLGRFFSSHPLTRDAPLEAWTRFASWQVRSRMQDEIIVSWIAGQKLAVRRGMAGATGNIYVGLHEFADMMLPLHFLREGDLFLDIGANIGSYTVLAAGVCRATTWAFEPDPETARSLKRNIDLNNLNGHVVVHELALGDRNGEVAFTRGLDTDNRITTDADTNVRIVQARRLDTLIGVARPSMIKMDVEGYEEPAIRGAEALLHGNDLKVIELETTTVEIESTFDRCGFKRAYYDPFRRVLTPSPNDLPASNALFVRDWDFVAARLATAPAVTVLGKSI